MKNNLLKSLFAVLITGLMMFLAPASVMAQVDGEFRSVATGTWQTTGTWQKYTLATNTWATPAAVPSGATAVITVQAGHIVSIVGGNISFKKLTVQATGSVISDGSERRMDLAADTSFLINNGNVGGLLSSGDSKLSIANAPACVIGTVSGTGTTSISRIRFNTSTATVTNISTLVIDQDMTVGVSGITAFYNNGSNTNAENCTITINAGRTVTSTGALHAVATPSGATAPGGNYTYNINGTLDMSGAVGATVGTLLHPANNPTAIVKINVAGTWKVGRVDAVYTGTNTGSVQLNILNGGLVDASKAVAFTLGSKYFVVSGNGKLKRAVPIAAGAVTFPIGTSATSYNPATITATSTDDTVAVNVSNTLIAAIGAPTKIVTKQWDFTPTGTGAGLIDTLNWQTADQGGAFSATSTANPVSIFRYVGTTWTNVSAAAPVTGAGSIVSPFKTAPAVPPATLSGQYVVGNSDAQVVVVPTIAITVAPGTTVCAGIPVTFTATTTNATGAHYQWKVNGINDGTDQATFTSSTLANNSVVTCVISFTVGGPIVATSNAITMTINPAPNAGTITGSASVCSGTSGQLSNTATGGVWSSSNPAIATVSATGLVTGVAIGSVTISYAVTNSCGTATATYAMVVTLGASAGTLSGASTVCPAATIQLASTLPGGAWSSNNTAAATVSSAGLVTGVAGGTATIAYVVTNGCGTDSAKKVITVGALPGAGTISGPATVCTGSTITLANTVTGGTWTSNNANATITAAGVVSGVTTGASVITYTATNTCGSRTATYNITISTVPTVKAISGPSSVCEGATITLVDSTLGGAWTNTLTGTLSVSTTGVVTGVAAGSDVVTYTVANACGTAAASKSITVGALPQATTVSGSDSVCLHQTTTLAAVATGGLWSSASGKTIISTDGLVTGLGLGLDTVVYTITNQCGTAKTMHSIQVWDCNPTGIKNVSGKQNLSTAVYPNPNNGSFNCLFSSVRTENVKIIITNMVGEVVDTRTAKTNEPLTIQLNGAAGLYFLNALTDGARSVTKVTITK